ncbi:hypothetical protein [Roseibium aggregatum]|uniref:hypothetical protein n=1 Tax=Roseibium aggregatum TaxID=187304 RepID=UPI001E4CB2AF|nr:hypothetical protein [Roseibium aggregatum]UES51600.1 hypothetical protein GFK88_19460 [Roseibium aggregatum]
MSLSRRSTEDMRLALKVATRRTVQMCGSQDAAAMITRVGPKTLSDYGNAGDPRHGETFMPIDVLLDLAIDCREGGEVAPLIEKLCELAGGRFVRVHEGGPQDLIDSALRDLMTLRKRLDAGEGDA